MSNDKKLLKFDYSYRSKLEVCLYSWELLSDTHEYIISMYRVTVNEVDILNTENKENAIDTYERCLCI